MSNHVKNQHYVPKMLLKNFSCGSDIWCYDKKWKKAEQRGLSSVASAPYFYDKVQGQKENSFEYIMGRAETDVAPVISKIIKAKSIDVLTFDEKILMALFTALQLNRTQSSLNEVVYMNQQLENFIKPWYDKENIEFKMAPAREVWLSLFPEITTHAEILMKKLWFLLESDNKFYTSDNPVVRQNIANRNPHRGTLGLKSYGIEIYFPLTPSLVLFFACEEHFSSLKGFKLPPCSDDNIINANHLQVFYSHRFIFAAANNFELAEDMISKGEVPQFEGG